MNRAAPLRRAADFAPGDFIDRGAVERRSPADFFADHKPDLLGAIASCAVLPPWVGTRWTKTIEQWDVRDFTDLETLLRELVVEQRLVAVGHRPSTFDTEARQRFLSEMDDLKATLQLVRNRLSEAKLGR